MTGDGHFERGRWIPRITPPEPTEADLLRERVTGLEGALRYLCEYGRIHLDSVKIVAEVVDGEPRGVTVTMITGPPKSISLEVRFPVPLVTTVEDRRDPRDRIRRFTEMPIHLYPPAMRWR